MKKLEKEKGIVIRFVIGHSATPGGVLDSAIDGEEAKYEDFLRLKHVEGYHKLSSKTRIYFSTAVSMWDADFYVKVDDDVHVNLGTFISRSLALFPLQLNEFMCAIYNLLHFLKEMNQYIRLISI